MKLVLIGPGSKPIPPTGWGAVESVIWDYYENLKKLGIDVSIVNVPQPQDIIEQCNLLEPEIVHIMYDDFIVVAPYLKCKKILYTSHFAYLTHPKLQTLYYHYFLHIFKKVLDYQSIVEVNAISPEIVAVYKKYGFHGKINVVHNGAREDLFKYVETPKYPDRTIYIAKVEMRKGQYKYQSLSNLYFVGNYHDSPFNTHSDNYLGEWDKNTLYENLTNYGNLLLLSDGEADPLVVKEALMAGLGVVVSECSSANLDKTKLFITIIPNDKLDDLKYIYGKIIANRLYSISHRSEIRQYALDNFAWNKIVNKYMNECMVIKNI